MKKAFWSHFKHFWRLLEKIYLFLTSSKTKRRVPSQQGVHTTCNQTYWEVSQQTYYMLKKNCFLPMKHLRVHMNSFERIRAFKIELEFGSVSFWGEGKTGETGEKPLGARKKTNNKLNPHLASTPGFEPGPRWWEASVLTTAPSLPPKTLLVQTLLASLDVVIGQNSALQWW